MPQPSNELVNTAPYPGERALLLAVAAGFLLIVSYLQMAGSAWFWPTRFTLSSEMTVGAWYSSALLLLTGVVCLSVWATAKRTGLPAASAMLALAVVLVALAVDEFASLHERYDDAEIAIPKLLRLPPIALVIAITLAYTVFAFWKHRSRYGWVWLTGIVAGFGLMGSVYAIELMEHAVEWPESWKPARLAVEEGIELLGMSLMLLAMTRLRLGTADADDRAAADQRAAWLAGLMLAALALPLIVLHHLGPPAGRWQHWGWPGLTAPSLLLLLAAVAAWAGAKRDPGRKVFWWVAAGVLLVGSLETSVAFKGLLFEIPVDRWRPDFVFLALGVVFIGLGFAAKQKLWWLAGLGVLVTNAAGLVVYKTPIAQLGAAVGAALLLASVARPGLVVRTLRLTDPHDAAAMQPTLPPQTRAA